jgi:hypothetical protein
MTSSDIKFTGITPTDMTYSEAVDVSDGADSTAKMNAFLTHAQAHYN